MQAGLEYLFWLAYFALILVCCVLHWICTSTREEPLPKPRCDLVVRGDHWGAGDGYVRHP